MATVTPPIQSSAQAPTSNAPLSSPSSTNSIPRKELTSSIDLPQGPNLIRLSDADLTIVRESLGGTLSRDRETASLLHPTSIIYPPKGLPDGLYKDVIRSRVTSQYSFYFVSLFFNISLVIQLLLGAAMTALGSASTTQSDSGSNNNNKKTLALTIFAAANTVNAGLLALVHNSGLPDRYKNDWNEFDSVERYLQELMETGIVRSGWSRNEVVADAWARYQRARDTVARNKPASYTGTAGAGAAAGPDVEHLS